MSLQRCGNVKRQLYFVCQKPMVISCFTSFKRSKYRLSLQRYGNVRNNFILCARHSMVISCITSFQLSKYCKSLQRFDDVGNNFVCQKLEGRVASDEDLKLSDTLRYYMRDSAAAKNLLYRRLRSLSNYENANKALDKARSKNKDVSIVRLQVNILLHHLRGRPK